MDLGFLKKRLKDQEAYIKELKSRKRTPRVEELLESAMGVLEMLENQLKTATKMKKPSIIFESITEFDLNLYSCKAYPNGIFYKIRVWSELNVKELYAENHNEIKQAICLVVKCLDTELNVVELAERIIFEVETITAIQIGVPNGVVAYKDWP